MLLGLALAAACSDPEPSGGPSIPEPPVAPQWHGERLGGAFDVDYETSLELGADGAPLVAYSAHASRAPVLERWGGASWTALGDPADVWPSGDVAAARTADGEPVLAWVEWDGAYSYRGELRAYRWSGGAWLPMGGSISGTPPYGVGAVRGASGPAGPVLAWREGTETATDWLHVVRWDGSAWVELPAHSGENLGSLSLALTPSGDPVLSVVSGWGPGHLFARWDPGTSAWVALPALTLPVNVAFVAVAVDGDGAIYAAATAEPNPGSGFRTVDAVHRLGPGELAWTSLGRPPRFGAEAISNLALEGLPGGGVAAGWAWEWPELARWKDGAWETVGTWTASAAYRDGRPLLRAAADDDLYLAFTATHTEWPRTMKLVRYRKY
jgi:hypothetical protein